MFKKFALWFMCFGLSFLVENWGWAEQGTSFLSIHIVISFIIVMNTIIILVRTTLKANGESSNIMQIIETANTVLAFVVPLVLTLLLTIFFGDVMLDASIGFYHIYIFVTLVECWHTYY